MLLDAPIIELDTIDSTNNYAMRLLDADTAQPGLTITAATQTQGKGQRGNSWQDEPGASLLMSIITHPPYGLDNQFLFSAAAAVAVANVLQKLSETADVRIKWPNDIIINDKKAGGILIENVLRGSKWSYGVIGLGLNVTQTHFPAALPHATSLLAEGVHAEVHSLREALRKAILADTAGRRSAEEVMERYNEHLFRKSDSQVFRKNGEEWYGKTDHVSADGKLHVVLPDGEIVAYVHGKVEWVW